MTEAKMVKMMVEVALGKPCMESLREEYRTLKLTGNNKECYEYLAEQFTLNYIKGKNIRTVTDDIRSGRFYNTWVAFLGIVKHIVKEGRKFHGSIGRGIEDIVNHSGISRKNLMKFLDYYFPKH